MTNYIRTNEQVYNQKFSEGWGSHYPDSNVITIYHKYIKENMPHNTPLKVLDFGCGRGTNLEVFSDMGFEVYGVDISSEAIKICHENTRFNSKRFIQMDVINNQSLSNVFNEKFNVIIATVSLTYLKRDDIRKVIDQFNECLEEGGVVIASFFERQPAYNNEKDENGMMETTISNLDMKHYTFILEDKEEMRSLFKAFNEITVGETKMIFSDFEVSTTYYIGSKMRK